MPQLKAIDHVGLKVSDLDRSLSVQRRRLLLARLNYVPSFGYSGMKWALPFFLVSFIGGWLVWSIQVPRWRL